MASVAAVNVVGRGQRITARDFKIKAGTLKRYAADVRSYTTEKKQQG
jgi:hypothetical protein